MGVGSLEPAQIGAVAAPDGGDENVMVEASCAKAGTAMARAAAAEAARTIDFIVISLGAQNGRTGDEHADAAISPPLAGF